MKNLILPIFCFLFILSACNKDDNSPDETQQRDEITFTGTWERQFLAGPENLHTATYKIYQDSIRYTLVGNVGNADYNMQRDTFLLENHRFIGHTTDNQYYLIFVKNITSDSLSLYKQQVGDVAEGMTVEVPSDDTTENHGWNVFHN